VPENWYHKLAPACPSLYQKLLPEKFDTKLHIRCIRNRYLFLVPISGKCVVGIRISLVIAQKERSAVDLIVL